MDNKLLRLKVIKKNLVKENKKLKTTNSELKERVISALLTNRTEVEQNNICLFLLNNKSIF